MPAIVIKSLFYLMLLLPVRLSGALGAGLGRLLYMLLARHRNIALRNLERIYPDKDDAWKIRIAHESFAEVGRTIFEMPHIFLRSRSFLRSRVEFDGLEDAIEAIEAGKGVIFTGCHYSNWELAALSFSTIGHSCSMIYRPLRQQPMELLLRKWRGRFGNILHSRDESIRWIPKALRDGESMALLIDQHLSNGAPVPFLGHPAKSTIMPAVYARKFNTPVFAAILHRQGRSFRFRIELRKIDFPEKSNNADRDLIDFSEVLFNSFAPAIHSRPELWLWIHRRWLYLDEKEHLAKQA